MTSGYVIANAYLSADGVAHRSQSARAVARRASSFGRRAQESCCDICWRGMTERPRQPTKKQQTPAGRDLLTSFRAKSGACVSRCTGPRLSIHNGHPATSPRCDDAGYGNHGNARHVRMGPMRFEHVVSTRTCSEMSSETKRRRGRRLYSGDGEESGTVDRAFHSET